LINNRQNGRRRGRGGGGNGPRQGGGGQGQRDSGNRIDSRARGNAAQLLEKYRNMARDAQMSGDRVNTEYYLQFADHYFRVLADQRGRADEQQPRQRQRDDFDQFGGSFDTGFDNADDFADEGETVRAEEQPRGNEAESGRGQPREGRREERRPRDGQYNGQREGQREGRDSQRRYEPRGEDREERQPVAEQPAPRMSEPAEAPANDFAAPAEAIAEPAPRRRGRKPREPQVEAEAAAPVAIDADRLPPAFGAPTGDAAAQAEEEAPKPRRRRVRTAVAEAPSVG
jgi:hypothetical protein